MIHKGDDKVVAKNALYGLRSGHSFNKIWPVTHFAARDPFEELEEALTRGTRVVEPALSEVV